MLRSVAPRLLVVVTLIAIASAFPALSRAQTPVAAPAPATAGEPAGQEWTSYGGNLYNQRYSGLDQINTQNVKDLKGAWVYHTNVYSTGTSFESVPIVVDGVMYLTDRKVRSTLSTRATARKSGNTFPRSRIWCPFRFVAAR